MCLCVSVLSSCACLLLGVCLHRTGLKTLCCSVVTTPPRDCVVLRRLISHKTTDSLKALPGIHCVIFNHLTADILACLWHTTVCQNTVFVSPMSCIAFVPSPISYKPSISSSCTTHLSCHSQLNSSKTCETHDRLLRVRVGIVAMSRAARATGQLVH